MKNKDINKDIAYQDCVCVHSKGRQTVHFATHIRYAGGLHMQFAVCMP